MKNKIFLFAILGFIFLISLSSAMISYCGDGFCQNTDVSFNESNPLLPEYCPSDCGSTVNARWCEDTYALIPRVDCPTCPTCGGSSCDISRISDSNLNNWCSTNGYSVSGSCGGNTSDLNKYNWLIFLLVGFGIGYLTTKNK